MIDERTRVAKSLARGGCVAPGAEADALLGASSEGLGTVDELVARRLRGEPLPWITGSVRFCGLRIHVDRGVYVPRPHTEALARRAADLLPVAGTAVDLCTGSGAIAAVLRAARQAEGSVETSTTVPPAFPARRRSAAADFSSRVASVPTSTRLVPTEPSSLPRYAGVPSFSVKRATNSRSTCRVKGGTVSTMRQLAAKYTLSA